jgi:hypothetical protein
MTKVDDLDNNLQTFVMDSMEFARLSELESINDILVACEDLGTGLEHVKAHVSNRIKKITQKLNLDTIDEEE